MPVSKRTYQGIAPLLVEFFVTRPIGAEYSYDKLAAETGFSYRQVRDALQHAQKSGRLSVPEIADGVGVRWLGLGPNAKMADRDRVARGPVVHLNQQMVGVATESIPAGGSGEIRLVSSEPEPAKEYRAPARHGSGCYTLVRELKDGALLLEDGHGELYKAVRI